MSKKETEEERIERLEKLASNISDTYYYIKYVARFLWKEVNKYYTSSDAARNLSCSTKELDELRESDVIETYDNVCYLKWGKDGCLNLLDESLILKPSNTPILDENIKHLIENLCWNKKENIDWLYKTILFKYTHLNDFTIPCVVFFGKWWSGKGTFMSLLSTIFGEENVMSNLWQRDLTSQFDTYKWQKLAIEFAEVITSNTWIDKKILNKLKNIIWAEKLTINEKWIQAYQIENIAWVFISSNSDMPILLDDKDKGNRRFTIIKSDSSLKNWKEINEIIKDKSIVSNFLSWLFKEYSEVTNYESIQALDNDDKKDLEDRSQDDANFFWEWFHEKFPDRKWKILKTEIEEEVRQFCFDNNINSEQFLKFFWKKSKYPKKKIKFWKIWLYWVYIK